MPNQFLNWIVLLRDWLPNEVRKYIVSSYLTHSKRGREESIWAEVNAASLAGIWTLFDNLNFRADSLYARVDIHLAWFMEIKWFIQTVEFSTQIKNDTVAIICLGWLFFTGDYSTPQLPIVCSSYGLSFHYLPQSLSWNPFTQARYVGYPLLFSGPLAVNMYCEC